MLKLIPNSDRDSVEMDCEASLSFHLIYPHQITVELMARGKTHDYSVSVNSEYLFLRTDLPTQIRISEFESLEIREDNRADSDVPVELHGKYSQEFGISEDFRVFYYYVNQSLDPLQSVTRLSSLGNHRFRFTHESKIDFYTLSIDTTATFEGVELIIWKDSDPAKEKVELLDLFHKRFDASEYAPPVVTELERVTKILFKPRVS